MMIWAKIKSTVDWLGKNITLVLVGIVGLLVYWLAAKNRTIGSLKAQIDLAKTQKEVDLLEVEIKESMDRKDMYNKEIGEYNKLLSEIDAKRQQLGTEKLSDQQVEDFWDKK